MKLGDSCLLSGISKEFLSLKVIQVGLVISEKIRLLNLLYYTCIISYLGVFRGCTEFYTVVENSYSLRHSQNKHIYEAFLYSFYIIAGCKIGNF